MNLFVLLLILYFGLIFNEEKEKFEGVYQINSLMGYTLAVDIFRMKLILKSLYLKNHYFRTIPINSEEYYIESVNVNKRLSADTYNILLSNKDSEEIKENIWNIIKIKKNEFLIQNKANKKLIKYDGLRQIKLSETLQNSNQKYQ